MQSLNTFGAQMNHGQTLTPKTHHNPNLGEATTFPFIVFSMLGHARGAAGPRPRWELSAACVCIRVDHDPLVRMHHF